MAKVQIINGGYQSINNVPLALGWLTFELSQDVTASGNFLTSGTVVTVPLDSSGNVSGTVLVWPNDLNVPSTGYYIVRAYSAIGQLVWGPQYQRVLSTSSPFDLNTWVPN